MRRIWLLSDDKIKSSQSIIVNNQVKLELNSSVTDNWSNNLELTKIGHNFRKVNTSKFKVGKKIVTKGQSGRSVDLETKLSSRNFSQKNKEIICLEILETWNQNSSFKYFRVIRIEKKIVCAFFGKSHNSTILFQYLSPLPQVVRLIRK